MSVHSKIPSALSSEPLVKKPVLAAAVKSSKEITNSDNIYEKNLEKKTEATNKTITKYAYLKQFGQFLSIPYIAIFIGIICQEHLNCKMY